MAEITQLLQHARNGDRASLDRVFEALYPELRRAAQWRSQGASATLSPTALVNELYLRLCRAEGLDLVDRGHFLACAARAMRGLMVDAARAGSAVKRGGGEQAVTLTVNLAAEVAEPIDLLDLNRALDRLEALDPSLRELVELRFFAGLELNELAELRGVSVRTLQRAWTRASAFLATQLSSPDGF